MKNKKDTSQKTKMEYLKKFKGRIAKRDRNTPTLAEYDKADATTRAFMEAGQARKKWAGKIK